MISITALLGWLGAIGLLIAFFLNSTNKIDSQSTTYLSINLFSSLLLVTNAYITEAYPFFVINIFWALVSVYSLKKKLV